MGRPARPRTAAPARAAAAGNCTTVLSTVDGYDKKAVESDASQLRTLVMRRTEALATNEVIEGS